MRLNADLANMEYRPVRVTGEYDLTNEVALRNQAWGNRPGRSPAYAIAHPGQRPGDPGQSRLGAGRGR